MFDTFDKANQKAFANTGKVWTCQCSRVRHNLTPFIGPTNVPCKAFITKLYTHDLCLDTAYQASIHVSLGGIAQYTNRHAFINTTLSDPVHTKELTYCFDRYHQKSPISLLISLPHRPILIDTTPHPIPRFANKTATNELMSYPWTQPAWGNQHYRGR